MHQYGPGTRLWSMTAKYVYLPCTEWVIIMVSHSVCAGKKLPALDGGIDPLKL